jgi:hypothetical protein
MTASTDNSEGKTMIQGNSTAKYAAVAIVSAAIPCTAVGADIQALGRAVNLGAARAGLNVRLAKVETYAVPNQVGQTIFFNDRAFRSGQDYVPHDSRRLWSGDQGLRQDDITYAVDGIDNLTHNGFDANPAIRRAMTTWDDVTSTTIPLTDYGEAPFDLGLIQYIITGGASGLLYFVADITHAGFLPKAWFEDALGPGAGDQVLAVTFSFYFADDDGNGTDINGDGQLDSAFAEVYYNNNPLFDWAIDGHGSSVLPDVDIQTVALHESGHALSQDHFGKAFQSRPGGPLHFAPYAVMNSAYSGVQQTLTGTDLAGHSQIWGNWPNR